MVLGSRLVRGSMFTVRRYMVRLLLFILFSCLFLLSCSDEPAEAVDADTLSSEGITFVDQSEKIDSYPKDSVLIRYGMYSGMCIGYCNTEFKFHSWGIEKINTANAENGDTRAYPNQRLIIEYKAGQCDSIYAALNEVSFLNGPDRVGCPGCNDLPAEEIAWQNGTIEKSILVQYGLTDSSIEPLMTYVRKLVQPYLYKDN